MHTCLAELLFSEARGVSYTLTGNEEGGVVAKIVVAWGSSAAESHSIQLIHCRRGTSVKIREPKFSASSVLAGGGIASSLFDRGRNRACMQLAVQQKQKRSGSATANQCLFFSFFFFFSLMNAGKSTPAAYLAATPWTGMQIHTSFLCIYTSTRMTRHTCSTMQGNEISSFTRWQD